VKVDKSHNNIATQAKTERDDSGIKCPYCGSDKVKKNGTAKNGKQRFLCCNEKCRHKTFVENYTYNAYDPNIRSRIFFSIINGNGTWATARTLGIAKNTVTGTLRNIKVLSWYVNYDYLNTHRNGGITADLVPVNEAEMDEMWNFVGDKSHQYWLWWAIDCNTGEPLAFHFGAREYENPDELLSLLRPFDIKEVVTGKENTQKIEKKYLSLRTWCSRLVGEGMPKQKNNNPPARVFYNSAAHKVKSTLINLENGSVILETETEDDSSSEKNIEELIESINKRAFQKFYRRWRRETKCFSSTQAVLENSNYQAIIDMGRDAVPYIIDRLRKKPAYLFEALERITGECPVKSEHAGHVSKMKADWIEWYNKKNT
jgi:insertion element IS1 protein InsB